MCPPVDLSENEMEEARKSSVLLVCVGDSAMAGVKKLTAGSKHGSIVICSAHMARMANIAWMIPGSKNNHLQNYII